MSTRGSHQSEEARAKMSAAKMGHSVSAETRAKISASQKDYKTKVCLRCGKEYQPMSGVQKYCSECRHIVKTEQHRISSKSYRKEHPMATKAHEKELARRRQHHADHREEDNVVHSAFNAAHAEQRAEYDLARRGPAHQYYLEHREEALERTREWNKAHPDKRRANHVRGKSHRRELGFIPINSPRDGYEAHHLDKNHVVYVPRDLHRSIPHNIWTGKNMDAINDAIVTWIVVP